MTAPELSRPVALHDIGARPVHHKVTAHPDELAALAKRFDLIRIDRLNAAFDVRAEAAGVRITGTVTADAVQRCVLSDAEVPAHIEEAVDLFATRIEARPDEEIELSAGDLDVVPLEGGAVDLGEIAAESFGLALDPFPRAPGATATGLTAEADLAAQRNPFRVLKGGKAD